MEASNNIRPTFYKICPYILGNPVSEKDRWDESSYCCCFGAEQNEELGNGEGRPQVGGVGERGMQTGH